MPASCAHPGRDSAVASSQSGPSSHDSGLLIGAAPRRATARVQNQARQQSIAVMVEVGYARMRQASTVSG